MQKNYPNFGSLFSTVALCALATGSLAAGCSSKKDPPANPGNSTGNTSSGGSASGGSTANGGSGTGGTGGAGGGVHCDVTGQVAIPANNFVCTCPHNTSDQCADVADATKQRCVSLMTDANYCGACGTTCSAGAVCNAGMCTAPPTPVATLTGCTPLDATAAVRMSPRMILANGVFYVTDPGKGTVSSIPVAGGAPTVLATGEMEPDSLAVDATSVYWSTRIDNTIRKVALAGGTVETLITLDAPVNVFTDPATANPPAMIAVSGGLVYFTHKNDIFTISTTGVGAGDAGAGTAPTPIDVGHCPANFDPNIGVPDPGAAVPGATYLTGSNESCFGGGYPRAIAANGSNLVYTVKLREAVEANLLDGSRFLKLGASQPGLSHDMVALTDTAGFWVTGSKITRALLTAQTLGTMGAVPNEPVVETLDFDNVTGMTITATHAYIASEKGRIVRGALATPGSMAEPVVRDQMGAAWLANDGTNLYWFNGDCSINTVPLPP